MNQTDSRFENNGIQSTNEPTEQSEKQKRKRLPKGAKPPVMNLKESVNLVQSFYDEAGGEAPFDLLSRLTNNSASSSVFHNKINLLRNLGLVEVENRQVTLSELGERIAAPREPKERMSALKIVFLNSDVFQNIYGKFAGKILPQDEYLINTFVDYVPREFAEDWMSSFKEAAQFAGLLFQRDDGKFQVIEGIGTNGEFEVADEEEISPIEEPTVVVKPSEPMATSQSVIAHQQKTDFQFLIEILNPADMSPEEQQAVWILIQYLKKKEAGVLGI